MPMGTIVGLGVLALVGGTAAVLEQQYRRRPGNALVLDQGQWELAKVNDNLLQLQGNLTFTNTTDRFEIMIPEVRVKAKLLSKASLQSVTWKTQCQGNHPDFPPRPDDYWYAYIVKAHKQTQLRVTIDIQGEPEALAALQTAWLRVHYIAYGPGGRTPRVHHVVVPLQYPDPQVTGTWRLGGESETNPVAKVLPIYTHLLTAIDDPVEVIQRYVAPHAQPGDVVTMGETPLAIMQGRYRHPSTVKPGGLARRICCYFLPTSSLATACGMQTLVDVVGAPRVFFAFVGGILLRALGQRGGFYQLAGEQARLIDDVTGTLPPYDQFIVLGPTQVEQVVQDIETQTGLKAAIVDVNDLKAVKVLAASAGVSQDFLTAALRSNPAGNADEQTPIVLLRPVSS
ncbi:MAG: F420-0:Gamma-glutamyl ligase [Prochlorotrichaceae cyanobacterium]